jgi:hypothetical protein
MVDIKKQKTDFLDNNLVKVFHFLELSGSHSYLIGSSNIRNILYSNDYDLNENLNIDDTKLILEGLYKEFLNIFNKAYYNKDYYITDFKNGINENHEPIRWNYNDMKKGFKLLNGKKYDFKYCLLMDNNMIKLDMCYLMNNLFTDINIVYNLHLINNKKKLSNTKKESKKLIISKIEEDIKELLREGNYFKVFKREFSIALINGKINKQILNLLNSDFGILYKFISNLKLIVLMIEQKFKPIDLDIIKNNL